MKNRTIIFIGVFLLTASAVTANEHENRSSYTGLEGYYWQYNDTGHYMADAELVNDTFSENIGYEMGVRLDEDDLDTDASIIVGVEPGEDPNLNAVFTAGPVRPETGETVEFNGSRSEGEIAEFRWDINGDGETDYRGETIEHVYHEPGPYEASLTAVNDEGELDTASAEIQVEDETSSSSGSSSGSSGTDQEESEENKLTLTRLPGQTTINDPVTVAGYVSEDLNERILIYSENDLKANISTDSDGRFSEEITPTSLGQKNITVEAGNHRRSGLTNVKPVISIADVESPENADVHENFDLCVETETNPEEPVITLSREGEVIGQKETGEACFQVYENRPGSHSYTVSAEIENYSEEEQLSVDVENPQNSDTDNPATAGFFEDNAHLLLSGLGILTAAGVFYRRRL